MKPNIKKEIVEKIEIVIDDAIQYLEESRFEPSERGAGTAPTDSAIKSFHDSIFQLIDDLAEYDLKKGDLFKVYTFEDILKMLEEVGEKASRLAEDLDELEEIEDFVGDNSNRKYRYINTVYLHKPTKKHLCIEEQRGVGEWEDVIGEVRVFPVEKKEIVATQWV